MTTITGEPGRGARRVQSDLRPPVAPAEDRDAAPSRSETTARSPEASALVEAVRVGRGRPRSAGAGSPAGRRLSARRH